MKILSLCLFINAFLLVVNARAQEHSFDTTSYHLPAPAGWDKELFAIPIEFAPSIPYKGQEEVRFAPGWGDANSEEYWSYVFMWFLQGQQQITAAILQKHLQAYYTGLVGQEIENRKIAKEKQFPVSVSIKRAGQAQNATEVFSGEIYMLDYMAQKPMTLHVRAELKAGSSDHTTILFQLSPAEEHAPIRKKLQELVDGFKWSALPYISL